MIWVPLCDPPALRGKDIHIWRLPSCDDDDRLVEWHQLLDDDELERAEKLWAARRRADFVSAHAQVRILLSSYTGTPPEELQFGQMEFGRPYLLNNPVPPLHFSVAHADGLSLCAVSLGERVGIDLERLKLEDCLDAGREFLSDDEHRALSRRPDDPLSFCFRCCVTRKNAFAKALGVGSSLRFDQVRVSFLPEEEPELLSCGWDPEEASQWKLVHLEPGLGYVGAVAVRSKECRIRAFELVARWPKEAYPCAASL